MNHIHFLIDYDFWYPWAAGSQAFAMFCWVLWNNFSSHENHRYLLLELPALIVMPAATFIVAPLVPVYAVLMGVLWLTGKEDARREVLRRLGRTSEQH